MAASIKPLEDPNLCIRTDNQRVDTSLGSLKTLYPVSSTFKTRQKSNSGRLIPFEAIDNKIYKTNSNCTCFLTSESRIHAWIKALAEVLYIDLGSTSDSNVVWRDHKDKSNIIHTEFIVNDKCKETDTSNEVMFKVIVYITTGKVMIQGKGYTIFGTKFFSKCLNLVNEYVTKTDSEQIEVEKSNHTVSLQDDISQSLFDDSFDTEETIPKIILNPVTPIQDNEGQKKTVSDDNQMHSNPCKEDRGEPISLELVDQRIDSKFGSLTRRIDVIEKSLIECTDKLSKNLVLHNENKNEVWSELSKLANQIKTTRICNKEASDTFDIQAFEKLMRDKDLVIQKLNGQIVSMKQENVSCREKVSSEQETITKNLKMEIQKLRNENLKIENENEQLHIAIKLKSVNIDNMKHIYEESLHEKDKLVDNLQDRLQTQMYDVQGGPWTNIPKHAASPIHNVSTTGRRDEPNKMGTCQLNTSNLNENNDTNRNMVNNSSFQGSYDVVMLHDSICKDIDINRLLRNTNRSGHKYTTYTIPEVQKFCTEKLDHAATIILHVGINDLKNISVEEAFSDYENAISNIMSKCDSLLLSLVTPCHYESLDQKVFEFNKRVFDKFSDVEKVKISMNSNFTQNGRLRKHLYHDAIRLSRDGVSVLAANLKRILIGNNNQYTYSDQLTPSYSGYMNTRRQNYRTGQQTTGRQTQTFRNNKLNSVQLASNITNAILSALNM